MGPKAHIPCFSSGRTWRDAPISPFRVRKVFSLKPKNHFFSEMFQTLRSHLAVTAASFSSLSTGNANNPQCQRATRLRPSALPMATGVIKILSVEIEASAALSEAVPHQRR